MNPPSSSSIPNLTAEAVAALPPPGLSVPSSLIFSPKLSSSSSLHLNNNNDGSTNCDGRMMNNNNNIGANEEQEQQYLAFVSCHHVGKKRSSSSRLSISSSSSSSSSSSLERQLLCMNIQQQTIQPLLNRYQTTFVNDETTPTTNHYYPPPKDTTTTTTTTTSLEERLRRERQRLTTTNGTTVVTQFSWIWTNNNDTNNNTSSSSLILRILIPIKGNVYCQDGIHGDLKCLYDKHSLTITHDPNQYPKGSIVGRDTSAIDPQLSPDGTMVAFIVAGNIHVIPTTTTTTTTTMESSSSSSLPPIPITHGATTTKEQHITYGLADFVAQEEMDRYRGFWWQNDSSGILFTKVDETNVPLYRITHQGKDNNNNNYSGGGDTDDDDTIHNNNELSYEDHRYPFCGQENPKVSLGYVKVHSPYKKDVVVVDDDDRGGGGNDFDGRKMLEEQQKEEWNNRVTWFPPPREASEYLARVTWLPDGTACAQWQNRTQTTLVVTRMDPNTGKTCTILTERSAVWINLHDMFWALPRPIHPDEIGNTNSPFLPWPLPKGSFSFLFASEKTGYCHLYLYTYCPGVHAAVLIRTLTAGEWIVESIVGVDMENDVVYITGTYDSPLQRHLYAIPLLNKNRQRSATTTTATAQDDETTEVLSPDVEMEDVINLKFNSPPLARDDSSTPNGGGVRRGLKSVMSALSGATKPRLYHSGSSNLSTVSSLSEGGGDNDCGSGSSFPIVRLTTEPGMHSIVMDEDCRMFVDTSSDLGRPTSVKLYKLAEDGLFSNRTDPNQLVTQVFCLYDAAQDDKTMTSLLGSMDMTSGSNGMLNLPPPEILSFPTSDGTETLHAALYKPDPRVHGPGPYPLICSVYGGPHVQRVNRSWSQCADMRAQRLRSLGFAVVKCDNRGSSRRGLAFESAIRGRLGRLEVLDQVTTVRQLTMRGIADPSRVGIYGWSYGGYLAAMCLCRAPDIFHVAIAGAPVTSWDGYDTHYTERYMGLPAENSNGYRESAVFDHVPNMRGKLMIVHGLIDENVHFRHTARLINRLIASGKDYDLLIFPDERHSPRRLRDRIYMEQRISDYFLRHLVGPTTTTTTMEVTRAVSTATAAAPRPNAASASSTSTNNNNNNYYMNSSALSNVRSMAGHL